MSNINATPYELDNGEHPQSVENLRRYLSIAHHRNLQSTLGETIRITSYYQRVLDSSGPDTVSRLAEPGQLFVEYELGTRLFISVVPVVLIVD